MHRTRTCETKPGCDSFGFVPVATKDNGTANDSAKCVTEQGAHVKKTIIGSRRGSISFDPQGTVERIHYECRSLGYGITDAAGCGESSAARPHARPVKPVFYGRVDVES